MSTVAEILTRIRSTFTKGQLNTVAVAAVTADLSQAVELLNDGLGAATVPVTRQVIAGTGLTGGGDLSADRTITALVDQAAGTASMRTLGTGATTAAAGNDSRLADARTPNALIDPLLFSFEQQDFTGPTGALMFATDSLNGGSVAIATTAGVGGGLIAGHPGLLQATSGIQTTGVGCANFLGSMGAANWGPQLGGGTVGLKYIFRLDQLSTVGQEFIFGVGAANNRSLSAGSATGMWFEYDRLTSVNWRIKAFGNVAAGSNATSTVPVTVGWHVGEIVVNAAATSVSYYMDGVLLGSLTVGIPTTNWLLGEITIIKSAGTTAVTAVLDYAHYFEAFTTPRNT